MLSTPTSIRAKIDGPTWAKDAADTPNPARSSSLEAPDRFFRSCFVANRMTRQRLQSAIKPASERSLSLARLPDDLHFQALTGQRVFRPVSYLNQGKSGGLRCPRTRPTGQDAPIFSPQTAWRADSGVTTLSIPPYRTLTHPVIETVPLVGAQPGQRQPR